MQEEHKKAIQRNFSSLVEGTDLDSMVMALYEKGVFSQQMIEPYRDTSITPRERKRILYREITRRGPQAFTMLLEALREMGHWDLVRDLDPNSPLQLRARRPVLPPNLSGPQDNFVSLTIEKHKPKNNNNDIIKPRPGSDAPVPPPPVNSSEPVAIPCFHVKESTHFFEDDVSRDIQLYRTRSRKRGVLVVFSYISFLLNIEPNRDGVNVDCDKLKYLFSEIGFEVLTYQNLTLEQTRATLEQMSSVLAGYECVFLVVSSHGHERRYSSDTDIRCSDGKFISLYAIVDYFNNRKLPNFTDLPKVFIFQACRGENEDFVQGGGALAPDPLPLHHAEKPLYSNILIANSTLPGFISHRDVKAGSWYIQVLCEVFAERAHDCHVDELFTLVDKRLRLRFGRQTSSVDRWGFNNKLYLHPGLYE
uniref:Caspase-5 isoform a n=1 Tax=Bombyx mori TaxID=7091 RepID=G0XQH2_BOMMO|nr:caspase-5 isoform a [Bombyx mori]